MNNEDELIALHCSTKSDRVEYCSDNLEHGQSFTILRSTSATHPQFLTEAPNFVHNGLMLSVSSSPCHDLMHADYGDRSARTLNHEQKLSSLKRQ